MIDYYVPRLDLTLLGCGFLGTYHLGAIHLLDQVWPQKPYSRICGASCGGLLGALLIAGLKLDMVLLEAMGILRQLRAALKRSSQLSAPVTIGELIERSLEKLLPENAHQLCTGRLGISLTRLAGWSQLENKFLTSFTSRRQLIEAVCAGCFIPIWSGALLAPRLECGSRFIDGAYSDNSPSFPPVQLADDFQLAQHRRPSESALDLFYYKQQPIRVRVSPFASQLEVSPRGESYLFKARVLGNIYLANWNNMVRTWHAMLPCQLAKYRPYLLAGHRDMKEFLFREQLIKCRQCYANGQLPSLMQMSNCTPTAHEMFASNDHRQQQQQQPCLACLLLLERVDSLQMSQELLNKLQD